MQLASSALDDLKFEVDTAAASLRIHSDSSDTISACIGGSLVCRILICKTIRACCFLFTGSFPSMS